MYSERSAINLGYHRLLTHRGFVCPKWLEYAFAILGMCCIQHTPAYWVAIHRRHHQYADVQDDPHSPLAGFLWGHFGWVLAENDDLKDEIVTQRYAKDLMRDPFYAGLEDSARAVAIIVTSWALFFVAGFAAEWLMGRHRGRGGAIRRQHLRLGRVRAYRAGLAYFVVGQIRLPTCGATAITQPARAAAIISSSALSATARAGTTTTTPTLMRPCTAIAGGSSM